jgi:hypothetical protein
LSYGAAFINRLQRLHMHSIAFQKKINVPEDYHLWHVIQFSLVEMDQRFGGICSPVFRVWGDELRNHVYIFELQ